MLLHQKVTIFNAYLTNKRVQRQNPPLLPPNHKPTFVEQYDGHSMTYYYNH